MKRHTVTRGSALGRLIMHPTRLVPLAFLGAILLGTVLLSLPVAQASGSPDYLAAAFTTVSAVCVTGLATVDTQTYWTTFGQVVILLLIQVGGFGIMTFGTLLALLVRRKLSLTNTLVAQSETHTSAMGDVGAVLRRVLLVFVAVESVVALILTVRFRMAYDVDLGTAAWHGVFHSVSAFNNAGFALYSTNLMPFVSDAWICFPLCVAIILGGIGFPVLFELRRKWRAPDSWSVHTRLTVAGYSALLIIGVLTFGAFEWTNPGTLGPLDAWGKLVAAVTGGVSPRTAGFNSVDLGQMRPETLVVTLVLMFIGGGSAGTAGGIKVTTFFLLAYVILAEARGEEDVNIGNRRVGPHIVRQALSVALLGMGVVAAGVIILVMITEFPLDQIVFESISAFATVGLSTGITPKLPADAQVVLMVLMFCGRVGIVTAASALALRRSRRHYHLPEERPLVG